MNWKVENVGEMEKMEREDDGKEKWWIKEDKRSWGGNRNEEECDEFLGKKI